LLKTIISDVTKAFYTRNTTPPILQRQITTVIRHHRLCDGILRT